MISSRVNSKLLNSTIHDVVVLDINSLFLFTKDPAKKLYEFINNFKKIRNNENIMFINVIDNGLCRRMIRKFPHYKANRITSKENHYGAANMNAFNKRNRFKKAIDRIHQIDKTIVNHLTFYATGESDFKIGYILKWISERTHISKNHVLTVANDKDMVLCSIQSDVILKRQKAGKFFWYMFRDGQKNQLKEFKKVFALEHMAMNSISDYYYYLLLNGDKIDNVKQILTAGQTVDFLNYIYIEKQHRTYNANLICKYIRDFKDSITINDIVENAYLIDMFNPDVFTHSQQTSMNFLLEAFFRRNNVNLI